MSAFFEWAKEWAFDILLMLLVSVLTAGLDAKRQVGVSCGTPSVRIAHPP